MHAIAPTPSPCAPFRATPFGRSSACLLTLLALGSLLVGCGSLNNASSRVANVITPYRVDIVQGNFVSREQVAALQPGMARAQVREVLGSPLVTSAFHTDRWDYVFTLRRQGVEAQSRKLTVYFKNDLFDRTEGDEMPTEAEFVSQINTRRNFGKVPLLEVPEDVLREFSLKNASSAAAPVAAAVVLATAPTTYPVLEAPGSQTQAWDSSTLRAATLAGAARPAAAAPAASPGAAPLLVAAAPVVAAPVAPTPPVAPIAAPVSRPVAVAQASVSTSVTAPPAVVPLAAATPAFAATQVAPSLPATVVAVAVPAVAAVVAAAPVAASVAPRQVAVAPAPVTVPTPAPLAPVAVAPAAPAVPSAAPFSSLDPELGGFLTGWMNDWQSRNATAFFARYGADFKGSSASREEWETLRRPRIEGRQRISIGVLDVRARMVSPVEARVVFRQVYESDAFNENGTKAMFLIKQNGRWIIDREFFTPAQ